MNIADKTIDYSLIEKIKTKWKQKIDGIRSSPLDRKHITLVINELFIKNKQKVPIIKFTGSPLSNFWAVKAMFDVGFKQISEITAKPSINTGIRSIESREYADPIYHMLKKINELLIPEPIDRSMMLYYDIERLFSCELFDYYFETHGESQEDNSFPYDRGIPDYYYSDDIIFKAQSLVKTIDHPLINNNEIIKKRPTHLFHGKASKYTNRG